ncbi:MAG: hypothetical protein H0T40_05115 [Geodermatophilaceae bacterium]|nr:hypothetical protein [Geodermatophilaceae bacterium]
MPAPTDIPAALRGGLFTLKQARSLGLSREVLRGRRFRRVLKEVFVLAEIPIGAELVARAALLRLPTGAVLSHLSAALLHRLPVADGRDAHVTLDDPAGSHRRAGVRIHRRRLLPGDKTHRRGLPVRLDRPARPELPGSEGSHRVRRDASLA